MFLHRHLILVQSYRSFLPLELVKMKGGGKPETNRGWKWEATNDEWREYMENQKGGRMWEEQQPTKGWKKQEFRRRPEKAQTFVFSKFPWPGREPERLRKPRGPGGILSNPLGLREVSVR